MVDVAEERLHQAALDRRWQRDAFELGRGRSDVDGVVPWSDLDGLGSARMSILQTGYGPDLGRQLPDVFLLLGRQIREPRRVGLDSARYQLLVRFLCRVHGRQGGCVEDVRPVTHRRRHALSAQI